MSTWTIFNLLLGLGFVVCGLLYWFHVPKFTSRFFGIPLPFVRKNAEIWNEAHKYASFQIIIVGIIIVLMSLLSFYLAGRQGPSAVLVVLGVAVTTIRTRKHIEKTFDDQGNRRS